MYQNIVIHILQQEIARFPVSSEEVFRDIKYPTSQHDYSILVDADVSLLHNTTSSHAV